DPEAREAYQLGRHFFNMQMTDKVRLSIEQFNRAIEIDPDYALAYFGLADSWVSLGQLDPEVPWGEGLEKGEEFALKALEIDSTLAEAHAKLGEMLVETAFDWEAAEKRYEKALRFNPNSATAHVYYSQLLNYLHRNDEAIDHVLRARKNDPLSQFIAANVIWSYQFAGRNDEALEAYRRAVELDPDNPVIHWAGACAYIAMRQYDEALALLHKAASVPEVDAFIAYCQARLGRRAEAEAYLDGKDESTRPGLFAAVYMGLGMKDEALECFWTMNYSPGLAWLQINPIFQDLFSDPRFRELMREKNFPGY
ncbi:MAG: tetratricopeptide repeat protein, partial [Candidatus Latescibacterota bacterium]